MPFTRSSAHVRNRRMHAQTTRMCMSSFILVVRRLAALGRCSCDSSSMCVHRDWHTHLQRGTDDGVDVVHGLQHALTQVPAAKQGRDQTRCCDQIIMRDIDSSRVRGPTELPLPSAHPNPVNAVNRVLIGFSLGLVAVTQLHGLMHTGRCTRRYRGAEHALQSGNIGLHGGVAARVNDLAALNLGDDRRGELEQLSSLGGGDRVQALRHVACPINPGSTIRHKGRTPRSFTTRLVQGGNAAARWARGVLHQRRRMNQVQRSHHVAQGLLRLGLDGSIEHIFDLLLKGVLVNVGLHVLGHLSEWGGAGGCVASYAS